ncbi:MAG: PRTRC system protein C [Chloroflexota bacterium]
MTQQTDPNNPAAQDETTTDEATTLPRIFKIGTQRIVEDDSMTGMTNEQVQEMLAFSHPEVANAKIATTEKDGKLYIEFIPKAGRKG